MFSKIILAFGLVSISTLTSAAEFPKQLVECTTESGGAKRNCKADVLVKKEAELSDFTITYDYVCRQVFSRTTLAFAGSSVSGNPAAVALTPGAARQALVREAKEVLFGYTGQQAPVLSSDCKVTVTRVTVAPAASVLEQLKGDAKRLTDLLKVRGKFLKSVIDTDTLIDSYSIPQLRGMVGALKTMFGITLAQAFGPTGDDFQAGICGGGHAEKMPSDFNLNYASWDLFDPFQERLVVLDSASKQYRVAVDRSLHPYYFEAKDLLPVTVDLLAQIANVQTATLLKESAAQAGFTLPDANEAKTELTALVTEARNFKARVAPFLASLSQQIADLNNQIPCEMRDASRGETPCAN